MDRDLNAANQLEEQGGQLDRDSLWRGRLSPWWQHHGETSLCEAGRFVYILLIGVDISERKSPARNTVTGSNELASIDDPRWLTGELVGVRRGMKCNEATRIAASKRHRGIAKTAEHNEKVSAAMKELAWYLEESTGKARRLKPAEAGHGFIRISGPHKKTPI